MHAGPISKEVRHLGAKSIRVYVSVGGLVVHKRVNLNKAYPLVSIFASLRRDHMACFWSLGRHSNATPKLACMAKRVPGGLPGQHSTASTS
jgi:hypothetical protein